MSAPRNQEDLTAKYEKEVLPLSGLLFRVGMRLTGSPAEAEDLVQETLLRAFRAFGDLRPDSQIRPWLIRILNNTFISEWRKRKRERSLLQPGRCEDLAPWLLPRTTGDATADRPDEGLGDEVVRALGGIPDAYRTCVLLVDLEQKSYKEAARQIGRPVGTVMSRLFRGRRLLQGMLDGYARQEGYLVSRAA
jgi:RNA polymerase sigma-70 factor (ECF subfamily)